MQLVEMPRATIHFRPKEKAHILYVHQANVHPNLNKSTKPCLSLPLSSSFHLIIINKEKSLNTR